jgi:hypothetical protein
MVKRDQVAATKEVDIPGIQKSIRTCSEASAVFETKTARDAAVDKLIRSSGIEFIGKMITLTILVWSFSRRSGRTAPTQIRGSKSRAFHGTWSYLSGACRLDCGFLPSVGVIVSMATVAGNLLTEQA